MSNSKYDHVYHCNYVPTKRGLNICIDAIKTNQIDINKPFDLFLITSYIELKIPLSTPRDTSRINTTGDIMMVINWIKENELNEGKNERKEKK